MIRLFCTKLSHLKHRTLPVTLINGYLYTTSSHKVNSDHSQSPTVSNLKKSYELSLQSATSASKKLQRDAKENPESLLNVLITHGLTQAQIKNLITNRPALLFADLDKTLKPNLELFASLGFSGTSLVKLLEKDPKILETDAKMVFEFFRENGFSEKQMRMLTMKRPKLYVYNAQKIFGPKLEFLKSLGLSELEIATILSVEPSILERSLENRLMPSVQLLRRVLGNDENVVRALKACYWILELNLEKVLEPNISLLASHGVPQSLILKIFFTRPASLLLSVDRLSEIIGEVKKLGFTPTTFQFVSAVRSMALMSKKHWENKSAAYRSFGLSKEEVYLAFKVQPMCMLTSEKKIRKLMGFFVNKLNLKPSMIAKNPNLLLLSLEKRILPRCSVLQILMSKELVRRDCSLIYMFKMTEKMFVKKVVSKYQDMVPEVIEAHQGKIEFQGFPV